jgi:tellurite methyltransferase
MTAEAWDQRYLRGEHAADAPLEFIAGEAARQQGQGRLALDLACGTGRHSLLLASHGWTVTAVDWSPVALASIRSRDHTITTVQADLEAGAFVIEPAHWDLICIAYFLDRRLFPAIRAGLRPGGIVIAAFPVEDNRPGVRPMNPAYLLAKGELATLFPGFDLLHSAEVEQSPTVRRRAELVARLGKKVASM